MFACDRVVAIEKQLARSCAVADSHFAWLSNPFYAEDGNTHLRPEQSDICPIEPRDAVEDVAAMFD